MADILRFTGIHLRAMTDREIIDAMTVEVLEERFAREAAEARVATQNIVIARLAFTAGALFGMLLVACWGYL